MRRRQVIAAVVGALAGGPVDLLAQQRSKVWRIGFIAHRYEKFHDPLFSGLKELGYVEGQNLVVERRYAEGNAERFKGFAAEMIRLNVDAVVVVTTPAAVAVKNETKTIPIIHTAAIDPVGTGLVASLAHPGGNVTGLAVLNAETSAKRVELLQEVVPSLSNGTVHDFLDSARMGPVVKMHTLGSNFMPPALHAGGLRWHGVAPLLSHLKNLGLVEAVALRQKACFEAGLMFARCEGIVPAPEANHAIRAAIDEALKCKQEGTARTILFNLSGHGNYDMQAYADYFAGKLEDRELDQKTLDASLAELPRVAA